MVVRAPFITCAGTKFFGTMWCIVLWADQGLSLTFLAKLNVNSYQFHDSFNRASAQVFVLAQIGKIAGEKLFCNAACKWGL